MGVDFEILMETKITEGIYTQFSSGYNVFASNAVSVQQGGIALFWKSNKLYEIKEWRMSRLNIITFVVVLGGKHYYAVGCYIPPTDLTMLEHVEASWIECPKGHIPILLGDLNIKLASPRNECNELITELVGNIMGLVDMSHHFRQCRRTWAWGCLMWRMRREGRWVSSQCDYILGREINHRRFHNISLRMPSHHDSDHCATIAKFYSGDEKMMKVYQ